jgi:hypothetical protein
MSKLFIAEPLNQLLSFWEDANLISDLSFQHGLMLKKAGGLSEEDRKDVVALEGSEINLMGYPARAIPNYSNLRKVMAGEPYIHPTHFLPRVPKYFRDVFASPVEFMDWFLMRGICIIPYYLQKWTETRRACLVEDSLPLPMIDLRKENFLGKLPYKSMYLNVKSPFVFYDDRDNEWTVQNFLIVDDGDYLRILFWPDETVQHIVSDDMRRKIKQATIDLSKGKQTAVAKECTPLYAEVLDVLVGEFAVKKDTSDMLRVYGDTTKKSYEFQNLYQSGENLKDKVDIFAQKQLVRIMEMINGFCKLMGELPKKQTVEGEEPVITSEQARPEPRQWFELPLRTVEFFHTENTDNNIIVIRHGSSSEKSPHIRRGHTRRLIQKDGTVKEVWIDQITVRSDKLTTEQLQGGALKVQ